MTHNIKKNNESHVKKKNQPNNRLTDRPPAGLHYIKQPNIIDRLHNRQSINRPIDQPIARPPALLCSGLSPTHNMATPPPRVWVLLRHLLWIICIYIYLYINLNPNLNLNSKLCVARSMNQTNCYRNRKSISIFVNVCKKLMPKILNDLQNKPVKILKKIPTKKQTKPHAQNPTYIYYIYIISIYFILMHIHAGPTSLCVLSSLSFLCVCALGGSVCASLSCSTTTPNNLHNNKQMLK